MTFDIMDGVLHINVDVVSSVAIAALLFLFGSFIKSKVKFLEKYCIPAPVAGTFLFMLITWFGISTNTFAFNFTNTMQMFFMLAFFATIGLGVSFSLLKKGGVLLIIYWVIASTLTILQNTIAVAVAPMIGLEYAYALLCGSISMSGGHGTSAAYGTTFGAMGYPAATLVGASASTFGLVMSVLIGGPIARRFVEKNNLRPNPAENFDTAIMQVNANTSEKLSDLDIMKNVTAILFSMGIGLTVSRWIGILINMEFPAYVCTMFVAMLVRNFNEITKAYRFDYFLTEKIGDVSLGLFLSMALMTLRLWELVDMAGAMFVILALQVLLIVAIIPIVFRILGRNYDAAVMCSGLIGHGLGATPSAIANMSVLNDRYGTSRKAMIIVPIVGAFLVDVINQPAIIWFISMFVENLM